MLIYCDIKDLLEYKEELVALRLTITNLDGTRKVVDLEVDACNSTVWRNIVNRLKGNRVPLKNYKGVLCTKEEYQTKKFYPNVSDNQQQVNAIADYLVKRLGTSEEIKEHHKGRGVKGLKREEGKNAQMKNENNSSKTHKFHEGTRFRFTLKDISNKEIVILKKTTVYDENNGGYCLGYDVKEILGDGLQDTYSSLSEWQLTAMYTKINI